MSYIAIDSEEHKNSNYVPVTGFEFAKDILLCAAYLPELADLSAEHVLCFIKRNEQLQLVVLLGSPETGSAYVMPDGRWAAAYTPVNLRGRPFTLLNNPNQSNEKLFCIEDSALNSPPVGEPLFKDTGKLSPSVQHVFDLLKQIQKVISPTETAVSTLEKAGVIKKWDPVLDIGDKGAQTQGLYAIDQEALNNLPAETYHALKGAPMITAYAQIFSMRNIQGLNARLKAHSRQHAAAFDFDTFMQESDSDTLQF